MAENIYNAINQLRMHQNEFFNECCVINGGIYSIYDIEQMGLDNFWLKTRNCVPLKLYKYFSNKVTQDSETGEDINYSLKALQNNEVFLNAPDKFDDVFDSEIGISWMEFALPRLKMYATRCDIQFSDDATLEQIGFSIAERIFQAINKGNDILYDFHLIDLEEGERLAFENFVLKTYNLAVEKKMDLHTALANVLTEEYNLFLKSIQSVFKISCFATTPFSQLMWGGAYADNHRGFCLEYTVYPDDPQYKELFNNLYPVIYCKTRGRLSEQIIRIEDATLTKEMLWNVYCHGALRKSMDWAYQNEWRLLLNHKGKKGFSVPFFPVTKVFLGNRMDPKSRAELINICHEKNIPYIGVIRANDAFEMQPCQTLCENCPNASIEFSF